ncbi:unnamed protein product [Toxocara canis]|uniref:BESS domain-containing protein n=1 Tax=Toxocara canis TaxID=6265 RepID=A0A183UP62_TOXCA|nr:unnamed protein product [Toxocara canis]
MRSEASACSSLTNVDKYIEVDTKTYAPPALQEKEEEERKARRKARRDDSADENSEEFLPTLFEDVDETLRPIADFDELLYLRMRVIVARIPEMLDTGSHSMDVPLRHERPDPMGDIAASSMKDVIPIYDQAKLANTSDAPCGSRRIRGQLNWKRLSTKLLFMLSAISLTNCEEWPHRCHSRHF